MKIQNLVFIVLILLCSCNTEDNDVEKSISEEVVPFTTAISNLESKKGVLINENTVTFTEDITIPEDVILNFNIRDRMIVNSGVTVTINGIIAAGKFQIFDIAEGGKITGCPQVEYIIPQWWGTDDTGQTPASDDFQIAIESFECVEKFVASGDFLLDKELLLNIYDRHYDFTGSHFVGIEGGVTASRSIPEYEKRKDEKPGGLITIGERFFDLDETYSVENISLEGGTYEPRYNHDNSLGILNSRNVKISDVNIIGSNGLRGIALQTPRPDQVVSPVIESIIIDNVIQEGGANVINIDVFNGISKNIIVKNIIGSSIDEINPQPHINRKEAAFRCSAQGDALRIQNLIISDVVLEDVYMGFELRGISADISNVFINNVEYRGITTQYADVISLDQITIEGALNSTDGIVTSGSETTLNNNITMNQITLKGKFNRGIVNEVTGVNANDILVDAQFVFGIYNTATNASFKDIFIKNSSESYYHSGIYNSLKATNSNYEGMIQGNFDHGFINAAPYCSGDFHMNGSFNKGAIFTFNSKYTEFYSSYYKGFMNFTDSDSKHINIYRTGDIYELQVYDKETGSYKLNP